MIRSFITKAATVATVATLVATPVVAQAQQVLNFSGTALINDPDPTVNPTGGVLTIDFLTRSGTTLVTGPARGTIDAGSNTLGITAGTLGDISDLTATPAAPFFQGLPNTNFVTLGGYTFSLMGSQQGNTFGPISLFQQGSNVLAGFNVNGMIVASTTNPSLVGATYTGSFSTQFNNITTAQLIQRIDLGQGLQSDFSARFDITAPTNVIPEPSTYALMASGVAMLGVFARRRRQA